MSPFLHVIDSQVQTMSNQKGGDTCERVWMWAHKDEHIWKGVCRYEYKCASVCAHVHGCMCEHIRVHALVCKQAWVCMFTHVWLCEPLCTCVSVWYLGLGWHWF